MSGFEWNKIAGAVLLAGLIAMVVGTVADALYQPVLTPEKRGFEVAVEETQSAGTGAATAKVEEVIDIPALLAAANPESGQKVSKKCAACHSFDKGGPNRVGPDLWDIVGREKATHGGFTYSEAMKGKGGNWDYDALFTFLRTPKAFIPGTKMAFAGIAKPTEVADLVSYLRTLSDSPAPLPKATAKPTVAESAAAPSNEDAASKETGGAVTTTSGAEAKKE